MSKARRVWALSSGSYSDYSVKALFPTKELAEAALALNKTDQDSWGEGFVESFDTYDELPDFVTVYEIQEELWDDGSTSQYRAWEETRLPWNHLWDYGKMGRPKVNYVRAPMHKAKGGRLEVRGTVEGAVKQAFSDNKARIRAERQGLI